MSAEISGGLIQMTAHMVRRPDARAMMVFGLIIAAVCAVIALCTMLGRNRDHRWRYVMAFAALALAGVVMAVSGARQPMRKVIYCCASGPVSLEQVAAKYDIVEVDGKLLTLAER